MDQNIKEFIKIYKKIEKESEYPRPICDIPEEYREIRDFALFTVSKNGNFFPKFSEEIKNDKEVAYRAILDSPKVYRYIPDELKQEKNLSMIGFSGHLDNIQYLPMKFRRDIDFLIQSLEYFHENRKNNVFRVNFQIIPHLEDDIVKNLDLLKTILTVEPSNYMYLPREFKNRKDLALIAIKNSKNVFEYFEDEIQEEKEIYEIALEESSNLKFMDDSFRKDQQFVFKWVKKNREIFSHSLLINDKDFVSKIIKEIDKPLNSFLEFKNRDLFLEIITKNPMEIHKLAIGWQNDMYNDDFEIMIKILSFKPPFIKDYNGNLFEDENFVIQLILSNKQTLPFIPKKYKEGLRVKSFLSGILLNNIFQMEKEKNIYFYFLPNLEK